MSKEESLRWKRLMYFVLWWQTLLVGGVFMLSAMPITHTNETNGWLLLAGLSLVVFALFLPTPDWEQT